MVKQDTQRHYWDVLEPHYDAFDLYGSADDVVGALAALPPGMAQLLAAHWCQYEVLNGGFHQFFFNSTGVLAPEAVQAFRTIGLDAWADALVAAMAHFGAAYPRERDARTALLPRPGAFDSLDRAFYAVLKVDDEAWDNLATAFAYHGAPGAGAGKAALPAGHDGPVTLETRKPVEALNVADLERFPVWTYALDEEDDHDARDETWVKPMAVDAIPDGALSLCVAAVVRLPCGLVYPAVLFCDDFHGFAVSGVALLTTEGRVLLDNCDTPRERAKTLKRLGLRAADALPMEYATRCPLATTGLPARGTITGIEAS